MTKRITRTTKTITTITTRGTQRRKRREAYSAFPTVTVDYYLLQEALRYLEKVGVALGHKRIERLVVAIDGHMERQWA